MSNEKTIDENLISHDSQCRITSNERNTNNEIPTATPTAIHNCHQERDSDHGTTSSDLQEILSVGLSGYTPEKSDFTGALSADLSDTAACMTPRLQTADNYQFPLTGPHQHDSNPFNTLQDSRNFSSTNQIEEMRGVVYDSATAASGSSEYDEIKAFLRWNSDPDIEMASENSTPTLVSTSSIGPSSENALVTQASDDSAIISLNTNNASNDNTPSSVFKYDPNILVVSQIESEAYFSELISPIQQQTGISDGNLCYYYSPTSASGAQSDGIPSSLLHGFELMTASNTTLSEDHLHYGYDHASSAVFGLPIQNQSPQQQQNLFDYSQHHHIMLLQQQFQLHQQLLQQHNSQQQQEEQERHDRQEKHQQHLQTSAAFRWVAANCTASPSTVSMSVINPQSHLHSPAENNPQTQHQQCKDNNCNNQLSSTAVTTAKQPQPLNSNSDTHQKLSSRKNSCSFSRKQSSPSSPSSSYSSLTAATNNNHNNNNNNSSKTPSFSPYKNKSQKHNTTYTINSSSSSASSHHHNHDQQYQDSYHRKKQKSTTAVTPGTTLAVSAAAGCAWKHQQQQQQQRAVVPIEHLESQQRWFRSQIAQHAMRQSKVDGARRGLLANLARIAALQQHGHGGKECGGDRSGNE
ncbi:hypothetical protein HK100_009207 [Physocladia obscura]|uniref:Uncharacterized protein n=1 Tax=Physocladia obscura TaxID=109957 RepID=A0AAD5ST98_9FUNG|nr:hypothetical protein HK100_009207 [Physocladia obscura]